MSQNSAQCIIQDARGFLWIGTQDGLNRFDGYDFAQFHYIRGDSTSLADGDIQSLYEDKNSTLWVGTLSGGLHRYEPETQSFSRFPVKELLRDTLQFNEGYNAVYAIRQVGSDSLLLGTGAGLILLDVLQREAEVIPYDVDADTTVRALEIDHTGRIWLGDFNGQLYQSNSIYDESSNNILFDRVPIDSNHRIQSISENRHGYIWVATLGSGVFKYPSSIGGTASNLTAIPNKESDLASDSVYTLMFDGADRLWIGYAGHGLGLKYPDGRLAHYAYDASDPFSIANDYIYSLLVDRTGVIWIGSWDGLNRLSPQFEAIDLLTHFEDRRGPSTLGVVAIEEDHAGTIWLGTMSGSLISYDRSANRLDKYAYMRNRDEEANPYIYDVYEDSQQWLWIITHGGGIHVLDKNRQIVDPPGVHSDSENAITSNEYDLSILEIKPGVYWFGTRHNGLKTFDSQTDRWRVYKKGNGKNDLSSNYVWPLLKSQDGDIWIGAYEGGLHRYLPKTGQFKFFPPSPDGLTSDRIFSLYEDSGNTLWIGTAQGLNKLDRRTDTFTNYQISDGLPHSRVMSMLEDDRGYLWIATNNGLSRFNPENEQFRNFYAQDGLQGNRFYARSALKLRDGRLMFGGPGGVNIIDPEKIHDNDTPPLIQFTSLEINGQPESIPLENLANSTPVELKHNDRFEISFSVLDFTNVRENRYRYKLNDDDWVNQEDRNFISFSSSLDYGDNTLVVQGQNSEERWTPELPISFYVDTPLLRKAWFQVLLVGILGSIVAGLIVLRVRYLLGIERLRLRIAKSLHDDLGGNLSTISIQTGVLQNKTAIGDRERRQLARISNMARDTAHKVREAVWLIDAEYDTLDRLVTKMKDLATTMFEGHISCSFTQQPLKMPARKLKMNFRQNVYYLAKEALNNANKYARASTVCMSVHLDGNLLNVSIRDDGVGFSSETVKKGNGLKFMRKRAEEIKGQLAIESVPGEGTVISLKVLIP